MSQIFHNTTNTFARITIFGAVFILAFLTWAFTELDHSNYATRATEPRNQPVPFSHAHHVGQLGIDCRYCHTTVESSGFANVPPTKTCMNCHQQMWTGADLLGPARESYKDNTPIVWNRVHNVPHYAYFNHSIHVAKGLGCVSCHGRIDQMNLTMQSSTLLMEWCIACHREPEKHLRPKEHVFDMTWTAAQGGTDPTTGE